MREKSCLFLMQNFQLNTECSNKFEGIDRSQRRKNVTESQRDEILKRNGNIY